MKKNRLDLLIGLEYTGFNEIVISFEIANRHTFAFEKALEQAPIYGKEDDFQSVFRLTREFLYDILQIALPISDFGLTGVGGSLQRMSATYDISDDFNLTGGIISYQSGDRALFHNIGDNDRLFGELRYSF